MRSGGSGRARLCCGGGTRAHAGLMDLQMAVIDETKAYRLSTLSVSSKQSKVATNL